MKKIMIGIFVAVIIVGGVVLYVLNQDENQTENTLIDKYEIDTTDIKQLVSTLEDTVDERRFGASVYSDRIDFMDQHTKDSLSIENEQFYLSVAPYINQTHPCEIHNLIGCQGEMVNEEFDVEIVDINGTVVFSETVETYANGFFGVWLPRDMRGSITVNYNGKTATSEISATQDSITCLATMQLR